MPRLDSVNAGSAQRHEIGGRSIVTAILKAPVAGRVMLRALGVEGDAQADRRFHGGIEKAVYLYGSEHYEFWRRALKGVELPPGTLGENLTIGGFERSLEDDLRVGDELSIGAARVRLTTPRQPCWKLETRMGLPGFAKAFLESGRIGMYARVVEEGEIGAGDRVAVARRSEGAASIRDLIRALHFRDDEAKRRVLAGEGLDPALRERIEGEVAPADGEG